MARTVRKEKAAKRAEELLAVTGNLELPVDPKKLADSEAPVLVLIGDDFRNRFDGQLEYHAVKNRFLLFYNTKYDAALPAGTHHPRTRFSIGHELGHFYLERHHAYLRDGGTPHGSRGEFVNVIAVEQEADAFAVGLLLPERLIRAHVNDGELTLQRIEELAAVCQTSLVSTAIRAVELSHFSCALVGLRKGAVAWSTASSGLIEAGLYPPARGDKGSSTAIAQWAEFESGHARKAKRSAFASQWFRSYEREHLRHIHVEEQYLPVPTMETLVVLLSVPEDELEREDEGEE